MDEKSLQLLEFPKVREILTDFAHFPVSQDLASNLIPSSDPEKVSLWLGQSAEARRLLSRNPDFSIGGARPGVHQNALWRRLRRSVSCTADGLGPVP